MLHTHLIRMLWIMLCVFAMRKRKEKKNIKNSGKMQ